MRSPVVVASILEDSVEATAESVRRAPSRCGLVEIRADRLAAEPLAALVASSDRNLIVTARLADHGGDWDRGAEARADLLRRALDAGARHVDVEWDSPEASWADGPDADRIILSHHGGPCDAAALAGVFDRLRASRAGRLKIVPRAETLAEVGAIRDLLRLDAGNDGRLAGFATGRAGVASRILAPSWGAWGTYGSIARGRETASGQLPAEDLLDIYAATAIGSDTGLFGLVGVDLAGSPSPGLHAGWFRRAGMDARYLPLEPNDLDDLEAARGWLDLRGFGVTIPFKEDAWRRCASRGPWAERCGAVNTVVPRSGGLHGESTDALAGDRLVRRHVDPAGKRAIVIGAGGTGRTMTAVLVAAGADVTIVNRTAERAHDVAARFGARVARWTELAALRADIWVQATPLGRRGEAVLPPAAGDAELVVDVAYGDRDTPAVIAARAAGIAVVDGPEFLAEQAADQFRVLTGVPPASA